MSAWEPSSLITIAIPAVRKCPSFTMICAYIRPTPAGQGSANDGSVSYDNRRGVRGAGSQPRAPRVSLHLGALVLFCGPADRELLSVLNSVAGAVSDGGPF